VAQIQSDLPQNQLDYARCLALPFGTRACCGAEGFGSFHGAVGPSVSGKGWAHRARRDAVAESWMIRLRADLASGAGSLYGCHAVDPVQGVDRSFKGQSIGAKPGNPVQKILS
jgi:hypothetical protein